MKNYLVLLFVIVTTLLTGCMTEKSDANSDDFSNPIIEHTYQDGNLSSKVYWNTDNHSSVSLRLTMTNSDLFLNEILLDRDKNEFSAKVDIPVEGYWDIEYIFTNDNTTKLISYTELLGDTHPEQLDKYKLDIITEPNIADIGEEIVIIVKVLDVNNEVVKNSDVVLEFYHLDDNKRYFEPMQNNNGSHELRHIFDKKGEWKITVHSDTPDSHLMREIIYYVGEDSTIEEHEHHHDH